MSSLLPVLLVLVLVAVVGLTFRDGIFSNALMLIHVTLSGVLATNFFEPLADWLTTRLPSFVYVWDLVAVWGVFIVAYLALRGMTDYLSKTKPTFPVVADLAVGGLLAAWSGWVLVCFISFTLHLAPMSREYFLGGFVPEKPLLFGAASPDRLWLGFAQRLSQGSLARGGTPDDPEASLFDPRGDLMLRYAARRKQFEQGTSLLANTKGRTAGTAP